MRTKELKIDNKITQAVLLAGGAGFKIYSASDYDGWVLMIGRKLRQIPEKAPEFKIVSRYINLKYQPASEQESVKTAFNSLLENIKENETFFNSEINP